jgi:hypothetical protein
VPSAAERIQARQQRATRKSNKRAGGKRRIAWFCKEFCVNGFSFWFLFSVLVIC